MTPPPLCTLVWLTTFHARGMVARSWQSTGMGCGCSRSSTNQRGTTQCDRNDTTSVMHFGVVDDVPRTWDGGAVMAEHGYGMRLFKVKYQPERYHAMRSE